MCKSARKTEPGIPQETGLMEALIEKIYRAMFILKAAKKAIELLALPQLDK